MRRSPLSWEFADAEGFGFAEGDCVTEKDGVVDGLGAGDQPLHDTTS